MRKANFFNLIKVLNGEEPFRPTLFEFGMNQKIYNKFAGWNLEDKEKSSLNTILHKVEAFANAGYDYATVKGSDFSFPKNKMALEKTRSLNEGNLIDGWESFENYDWPEPESFDYLRLRDIKSKLPGKMKLIVSGPGGVLENAIDLVGYESLCYMMVDDSELTEAIFNKIGEALHGYYEICSTFETVGALIVNDDWGFKTQTILAPDDLRKYVFPWNKKIVKTIHSYNKYAILHSCGNLEEVMDDIINDMNYDAKHSFEDVIMPVEDAYDRWGDRIAILGGIDLDFLCRSEPSDIKKRSRKMLEKTKGQGGYALGTGNSVPEYVPVKNYLAMISVATDVNY